MKYRHKKIKREHSIINGALDWLEDLSRNREVTDIIPGVIDVTHSKERGIFFKYETSSGCKLLVKNGGSIQEVFVVTSNPQTVQQWVAKIMAELDLMQSALTKKPPSDQENESKRINKAKQVRSASRKRQNNDSAQAGSQLVERTFLGGIRENYQLVEINKALRDSFMDSLATMADIDKPKLEDVLDSTVLEALKQYKKPQTKK
ncbi:MAG: hypothetical protein GX248_12255 [Peptococcaceae bacterium]|jgi:hypothetical protein|nr:hypothetical protein [Peptococcaceae bacterium]